MNGDRVEAAAEPTKKLRWEITMDEIVKDYIHPHHTDNHEPFGIQPVD
jgi:hypothetical protein